MKPCQDSRKTTRRRPKTRKEAICRHHRPLALVTPAYRDILPYCTHHHRNTILEAEEDGNDCEPIICVVHLPSSADTASLEPGRCPGPAQAAPEPLARITREFSPITRGFKPSFSEVPSRKRRSSKTSHFSAMPEEALSAFSQG